MDIWGILGIEPTTYSSEIKKAYLTKLKVTHPEEKPEEFAELKSAYDLALKYEEIPEDEKSDFLLDLEEVYFDFKKRMDIEIWKELLGKYIDKENATFESLAENKDEEIRDEILEFFMDNYYVGGDVFKLLESEFNLELNRETLYDKFPPQFIDFIISRVEYGGVFPFEYLDINKNISTKTYDDFVGKTLELGVIMRKIDSDEPKNVQDILNLINEIESFGIDYCENDYRIIIENHKINNNQEETEKSVLGLIEKYENSKQRENALKLVGIYYYDYEKYDKALTYFEQITELAEKDEEIEFYLAISYFNTKQYIKAHEKLHNCLELQQLTSYWKAIRSVHYENSKQLIDVYLELNEKEGYSVPENIRLLMRSYYNAMDYEKAFETFDLIKEEDRTDRMYDIYMFTVVFAKKYDLLENAIAKYEELSDTKDSADVARVLATYYNDIGEYEKTLEVLSKHINNIQDELDFAEVKFKALKKLADGEEVIRIAREMRVKNLANPVIAMTAAEALYTYDYYEEAFDFAQMVHSLDCQYPRCQELRMACLVDMNSNEEAISTYDWIKENDLETQEVSIYAVYAFARNDDYKTAHEIIDKVLKEISVSDKNISWAYSVKTGLLIDEDNLKEVVQIYKKSLELNGDDVRTIINLSSTYMDLNKNDEVENLIFNVIFGKNEATKKELEDLSYEDYKERFTKDGFDEIVYKVAKAMFNLRKYDKAFILFEKTFEYSSVRITEYSNVYYLMAQCYYTMTKYNKALEYAKKSIEVCNEQGVEKEGHYTHSYRIIRTFCKNKFSKHYPNFKEVIDIFEGGSFEVDAKSDDEYTNVEYIAYLNERGLHEKCIEVSLEYVKNENFEILEYTLEEMKEALLIEDKIEDLIEYVKLFEDRLKNTEVRNEKLLNYRLACTYISLYKVGKFDDRCGNIEEYLDKAFLYCSEAVKIIKKESKGTFVIRKGSLDKYILSTFSYCYMQKNNKYKAKKYANYVKKHLAINRDCCYKYAMSYLYFSLQDYDNALKYALRAKDHVVEGSNCHYKHKCLDALSMLGKIYTEMGEYEKAIEYCDEYLDIGYNSSAAACKRMAQKEWDYVKKNGKPVKNTANEFSKKNGDKFKSLFKKIRS